MNNDKAIVTRWHRELAVKALHLGLWMKNCNDVNIYFKERWLEEGYTAFSGISLGGQLDSVAQALADMERDTLMVLVGRMYALVRNALQKKGTR